MIENDIVPLGPRDVSNIIQRGGTMLRTARSAAFRTPEGRAQAADHLQQLGIEGVVVIGGDGSYKGAHQLMTDFPHLKLNGAPGTIDNDLYGTAATIGFDTAVNTAMEAIDKIRDTAAATDRLFFVEVMGRDAGFIALRTGIACGAEAVLVPETPTKLQELIWQLRAGWEREKTSSIVVVAEGDEAGGAVDIAEQIKSELQMDYRITVLGHIQRGGSPTAADRLLASELGAAAVEGLLQGETGLAYGKQAGQLSKTPLEKAVKHNAELSPGLLKLLQTLSA